jgi:hypothetical protein
MHWIQIGTRYLNLANVIEVRIEDQPRQAHVFFAGGGVVELDEEDTLALISFLDETAVIAQPVRRSVSAPVSQR